MKEMKKEKMILVILMLSMLFISYNKVTICKAIAEEKVFSTAKIEDNFKNDEILITLTNEESLDFKEYTINSFGEINCVEVTDLTAAYKEKIESQKNGTYKGNMPVNLEKFNRLLKLTLGVKSKEYVLNSIMKLEEREDILIAVPNMSLNLQNFDIQYSNSRSIINSHQYIDLNDVWEITTGSSNIKVGVIDSGISGCHTDLNDNINSDLSCSMSDSDEEITLNPVEDRVFANPLYDSIGHGTSVAGIIGAEGDNNSQLTGVCWDVSLVSLKSFDNNEFSSDINKVINAFSYAATKEIPIVNCSFGWYNSNSLTNNQIEEMFDLSSVGLTVSEYKENYMISTSTANMLKEGMENYGGLVVCAAGNENLSISVQTNYESNEINSETNIYFYPASFNLNNIVVVGSATYLPVDEKWVKSDFSNYGTAVDIYAPGEDVYVLMVNNNDESLIGTGSGTSFSAPYISGIAALILSRFNLSAIDIKYCILESADYIHNFVLDETENYIGSGEIVNPYEAVNYHIHSFSYEFYSQTQHNCICNCGYSKKENHTWGSVNIVNFEYEITAVPGYFVCTKCYATKVI